MKNQEEDDLHQRVDIQTPWFKLMVDKITWKEVLVVAMVLLAIVYIVKA